MSAIVYTGVGSGAVRLPLKIVQVVDFTTCPISFQSSWLKALLKLQLSENIDNLRFYGRRDNALKPTSPLYFFNYVYRDARPAPQRCIWHRERSSLLYPGLTASSNCTCTCIWSANGYTASHLCVYVHMPL